MTHLRSSRVCFRVAAGDRSVVGESVQNDPEYPDIDGREDFPEALLPERSDKEVHKLVLQAVAEPGTAETIPNIMVTPDTVENVDGSLIGDGNSFETNSLRDKCLFRWTPSVLDGGTQVSDWVEFDFHHPIDWPDMDLMHVFASWDDANHAGLWVNCNLLWEHQ